MIDRRLVLAASNDGKPPTYPIFPLSLPQPNTSQAAGLERQIGRCADSSPPDFCADDSVRTNALAAYNHLWDLIEANSNQLSSEVWSWVYNDGEFQVTPLGSLPPPSGSNPTESNVRQLWSLTFLAVKRNEGFQE